MNSLYVGKFSRLFYQLIQLIPLFLWYFTLAIPTLLVQTEYRLNKLLKQSVVFNQRHAREVW